MANQFLPTTNINLRPEFVAAEGHTSRCRGRVGARLGYRAPPMARVSHSMRFLRAQSTSRAIPRLRLLSGVLKRSNADCVSGLSDSRRRWGRRQRFSFPCPCSLRRMLLLKFMLPMREMQEVCL